MLHEPYQYDLDNPLAYRNAMGRYKTRRQLDFIRRHTPTHTQQILDIGGGGGRLAVPLAEKGHKVTVADPSAEALRFLRERANKNVLGIQGDLMSFAADQAYDLAIISDSLKYMKGATFTELFSKVNALLSAEGLVVVAEMNTGSWRTKLSKVVGRGKDCGYNIGTVSEYVAALATAGFEVKKVEGYLWMPFVYNSNSPLVNIFAFIERTLGLGRLAAQSPWVLIAARKVRNVQI